MVSVSNTATPPAASLDVTPSASGGATASGSISLLAPGATDYTDISVGLDTTNAGADSGAVTLSLRSDDGSGNTMPLLPNPNIDVFGSVYRLADPSVPNNLTVHIGDPGTQTIAITNLDPNDGYSENLIATVVGTTGAVTASGTTGDIAPQADGTIAVNFSTATAGPAGTVTLDLKSDGTGIDGLGVTDLGDVTIPVTVTPDNIPAAAQFEELSGGGTFTQNASAYTLNLGTIAAPTTVNLGVLNSAAAPADDLGGSFTTSGDSEFTNSGFGAFSGIAAGSADTTPSVTLYTGVAGTFTETITLAPTDTTTSAALPDETLTITGTVNTATPPVITAPSSVLVQQNQASPVAPVTMTDPDIGATVTATLFDAAGLLAANTGATGGGGTITGSGTTLLTIAGTLAQVNADLTTLADTDSTLAADSIAINASDSVGGTATPAAIAVTVNAPPAITAPASALVQQGQASAVASVSISDVDAVSAGETITATLADANGLLSANTSATGGGGTISTSGTTHLTISGTLAQVNSDLTTLTDTDGSLSPDGIAVNASDGRGGTAVQQTIAVSVAAPPVIAAPASITVRQGRASAVAAVNLSTETAVESFLAGQATPITEASLSDANGVGTEGNFTVTLADTVGLLAANTGAPGRRRHDHRRGHDEPDDCRHARSSQRRPLHAHGSGQSAPPGQHHGQTPMTGWAAARRRRPSLSAIPSP